MRRPRLTFGIVLALVLVAPVSLARADCFNLGPLKKAPKNDDHLLLFTGTVTQVGDVTVSFDVDRVWSGRVQRHMTIAGSSHR